MTPNRAQMGESGIAPTLRTDIVDGAAAGDVAVPGITPADRLAFVVDLTAPADLTDEFEIAGDDTINNEGGTSTDTNDVFVAWWHNPDN